MGCLEIARWREQLNSVRKYIECVRTHPSLRAIADVLSWRCWVAALATCTLDLPIAISFAQCVVLAPCDGARWNCGDVVIPRVLSGAADRLDADELALSKIGCSCCAAAGAGHNVQ
ncbi:putative uncharacterized protein [Xanthomonas citri pv. punicae str. LMG 859]|nr:putative uncharacterized protein [Xanthomonas citri pv. punicae str. LMG 859]